MNVNAVHEVADLPAATCELDLLILSAGFEDRATAVLSGGRFNPGARCLMIEHRTTRPDGVTEYYRKLAAERFEPGSVVRVELDHDDPRRFEGDLQRELMMLPRECRRVGIDISGLPSHAICSTLKAVRDAMPMDEQSVFYTAALEYNPDHATYLELVAANPAEIELLPKSMALEMADNLILDSFSGYRSQSAKACLALFAGYEGHRSTGVVEAVNPALLILFYGQPGDEELGWRLDLSRRLHRKFERGRPTAVEIVSTLHLSEALEKLEAYYDFIVDDYDMVISPVSSKMHSVAAFLFWEKYREVQLTFPIPIGYDPTQRPKGIGKTFETRLGPRLALFRGDVAGTGP